MGTSKSKPRSSSPNFTGATQHSHLWLARGVYKAGGELQAKAAQKAYEERRAKALNPEPERGHGNRKHSAELIAEVKAMHEAGWPPREIRRVTGLNEHTLSNLLYNIPDGMSAARAKGRWDGPRRRK